MAVLATQKITRAGMVVDQDIPMPSGDQFVPTRHTYIWVTAPAGGCTVSIPGLREVFEAVIPNPLDSSPAAAESRFLGPFEPELFGDLVDGLADVEYITALPLNIAVVEIAPN